MCVWAASSRWSTPETLLPLNSPKHSVPMTRHRRSLPAWLPWAGGSVGLLHTRAQVGGPTHLTGHCRQLCCSAAIWEWPNCHFLNMDNRKCQPRTPIQGLEHGEAAVTSNLPRQAKPTSWPPCPEILRVREVGLSWGHSHFGVITQLNNKGKTAL